MNDNSPKKSLGQHWLRDRMVLDEIVHSAQVVKGDDVLEIGPGLGTLTARLLHAHARVTALEYDPDLASNLISQPDLAGLDLSALHVFQGDIRSFDYSLMSKEYKIVANIPYYLTSYLMRSLCDTPHKPSHAALLMQREVAERIATEKKRSLLSVLVQYYYDTELGMMVGRELFTPPPKVDSMVLVLKCRDQPRFDANSKQLLRLFKAGFSEKRKNLKNALSGGLGMEKGEVSVLLKRADIAETRRAESLSWADWEQLYNVFVKGLVT